MILLPKTEGNTVGKHLNFRGRILFTNKSILPLFYSSDLRLILKLIMKLVLLIFSQWNRSKNELSFLSLHGIRSWKNYQGWFVRANLREIKNIFLIGILPLCNPSTYSFDQFFQTATVGQKLCILSSSKGISRGFSPIETELLEVNDWNVFLAWEEIIFWMIWSAFIVNEGSYRT